ncbi:MAG TPA: 23S rRNA (uracil(1939)-C(5))-methyltransferase RlmD [Candidatus Binatia bacterium]
MEFEVSVESLAYGGSAVARHEGRVVFVPGAAPGDRVRLKVVRDHGSWAEAEMVRLVEAGPSRVTPPCPIVHECGGCPWQHVAGEQQLAAKRQAVIDALTRIAGLHGVSVLPIVRSPRPFGYRNRLSLRFENGRIGFYQARTRSLVPVPDCLLAEDVVRDALGPVEEFVAALTTRVMRVEIASRGLLPGVSVAVQSAGRLRPNDTAAAKAIIDSTASPIAGLVMQGRGWTRAWGDARRRFEVAPGIVVDFPGACFGQVNTEANLDLVALVTNRCTETPPAHLVELYAGAGNFSFALAARSGRVLAVDEDENAVAAARIAARDAGLRNLRFAAARAERWLAEPHDGVDVLLVDPPRSGLGPAAGAAAALAAPRVVYVSCNPATLARDLRTFAGSGYRVVDVVPVDLFPQTFHVETVCTLELT